MMEWCFWFRTLPNNWSQRESINSDLSVYGIQDLGSQLAPVAMLVMMEAIQQRILDNATNNWSQRESINSDLSAMTSRSPFSLVCAISASSGLTKFFVYADRFTTAAVSIILVAESREELESVTETVETIGKRHSVIIDTHYVFRFPTLIFLLIWLMP